MRRYLGLLASALLLVIAITACRDPRADTAPATTTNGPTSTTLATVPEVVLIDPGAEPRRPLRIHYTPGAAVTVDLTIDQAIDQTVTQGELARPQRFDSPPITQRLTYTVHTVDESGQATFGVAITSARAQTDGTELDAEAALLLQAELQPLVGLTGEGQVNNRGVVDHFKMDLPNDLDPHLADQITALNRQIRTFGPSFPLENVGQGAQWEITSTTVTEGITLTSTTTYTMTELTNDLIGYTATIAGTAEPQPLELFDLEATSADLVSSTTTGNSTGTQSLTGLGFTLRTEISTIQEVRLDSPDGPATLDQVIETDIAARLGAP